VINGADVEHGIRAEPRTPPASLNPTCGGRGGRRPFRATITDPSASLQFSGREAYSRGAKLPETMMKRVEDSPTRALQVYHSIRDSICEGSFKSGEHLVQENLAAQLGVSRQPVQQAMVLLKNDGLVLERGSRGLYVAPLDAAATTHRYQIRLGLDQLAARLTALRAAQSKSFAAKLREDGRRILEAGDRAVAEGLHREAVASDVEFHSFIYERSGNPLIAVTAEPLWHYLRRVMITVLSYADRGPTVWKQHRLILRTLASGNAEKSVELVTTHIEGAQTAILGALSDVPAEFENEADGDGKGRRRETGRNAPRRRT
jgi:DNA-binding GntR family transcriptional regulator